MEPHKQLDSSTESFRPPFENPKAYFAKALEFARANYAEQMDQIGSVKHELVDPDHFFIEYTWVVHATGFSAKAVGKFMPRLVEAYGPYEELAERSLDKAVGRVKVVCNNPQKIKAVHTTARLLRDGIKTLGWEKFRQEKLSTPEKLQELPYIGPVTRYHLARNIGLLDCVKPDLHLIRLAKHWGFPDCVTMCKEMGEGSGLPLGIVDLVVWYAASHFGTLGLREEGDR
jgi:endonuclease III